MKESAKAVIIGGGIFGTSVAYHLAKAGCTDIVLVDKGELTSGTTFHSVGLVSQFRTSPSLMRIMNYSVRLFNELAKDAGDGLGWHTVGSMRLASSPERLKSLRREVSRARAIGIEAELVTPAQVKEKVPFISDKGLYGAVWVPDDGHIDPNAITYELARRARSMGAEICTNVRVDDIELDKHGRVEKVMTDRGEILAECVVNAAGEWTPRIGAMAGARIPMVPLMHQYLTTKPVPGHELSRNTPVVRDPDNLFYCREDVGAFLIGAFELNPKAWSADGVPWSFNQQLLGPEWELFEPVMENAVRRIPVLEKAEIVELINGPDAFTHDGHYALGPVPGIPGFYVAAGGSINGIAGAGGVGKVLAEWIVEGAPSIDTHEMNVRRFGAHLGNLDYLTEKCREVYRYYYQLHFPDDENEWGRPLRISPFYPRLRELGAVFGEKNGWERVNYFDPGKPSRLAGADQKRWGWGKPDYFHHVAREVRAVRERAGMIDMTSFGKIEVSGPGAPALLQRLSVSNLDKPAGSVTYTQFLNESGGIESDVTVSRLNEDSFRVISGTSFVDNDLGWLILHLPTDGGVTVKDITNTLGCLCLCGPDSGDILASVAETELSDAAFPSMSGRYISMGGVKVWAQRISYTGETGWELYIPKEDGPGIWDALMNAGASFGLSPFGYKALETLRIEKGFLYWSGDITPDDNPLEAGLGFAVDWDKGDFIGRDALIRIKKNGLKTRIGAVLLDADHGLFGGESVYYNGRLVDRIRSAAHGHTIGRDIGLIYLPKSLKPGMRVEVDVLGKRIRGVVSRTPLV